MNGAVDDVVIDDVPELNVSRLVSPEKLTDPVRVTVLDPRLIERGLAEVGALRLAAVIAYPPETKLPDKTLMPPVELKSPFSVQVAAPLLPPLNVIEVEPRDLPNVVIA